MLGRNVAVAALTAATLSVGLVPAHADTTPVPRPGLGLLPSPVVIRASASRVRSLGVAAGATLPTSVDLTANAPTPGDQGPIGSCVSWSIAYTQMGWFAKSQGHAGAPFAPMYVYSQTHVSNSADGGGSYTQAAYEVTVNQGVAEQAVYTQGLYNFTTAPTSAQRANASLHKTISYSYLFSGQNQGTAAETAIKTALANNTPVGIAIPVYSAFFSLNASDNTMTAAKVSGQLLGGHAVTLVGYDSTGATLENSWGTGWGKGGFARLSWDFINRYVYEAAVLRGMATSGVVPGVTKLSLTSGALTGGKKLTISGTDLQTVDSTSPTAVTFVNVANPSLTLNAPVVTRTSGKAATLSVNVPAATQTGAWRVVVRNTLGSSADTAADDFTYVGPTTGTFAVTGAVSAAGGKTRVEGSGYGSTRAEFGKFPILASVNGVKAPVTWVADSVLDVTLPAGTPGTAVSLVLSRLDQPGAAITGLTYAAVVTRATVSVEASTGAKLVTVTGRGLSNSTGWTLTGPDGSSVSLPTQAKGTPTAGRPAGALMQSDTTVSVKLPSAPGSATGTWTVTFTPSGGSLLSTSAPITVTYAAPKVSSINLHKAARAGGAKLVVRGSGFGQLDLGNSGSFTLVSADGTSTPLIATARTDTTLNVTTPALAAGLYEVRVASSLGTSADAGKLDDISVA